MCFICSLALPKSQCTWTMSVGGFISRAAEFIHKWWRTVLSSLGYWGQIVDLSLGPTKQIRIHAVEGCELPHIYINWLDYGNSFSGIQMDCLWQTICILERTTGKYYAEPTFKLFDVMKQNKKLSYRRGTARCIVSIEILPIATQQCRNYLYDKFWPNRWYQVGDLVGSNAW